MAAKRKGEWNGRGTDRQAIQVEEGGIQAKNLFSLQLHVVCGEGRIPPLLSLTLSDFTFFSSPQVTVRDRQKWRPPAASGGRMAAIAATTAGDHPVEEEEAPGQWPPPPLHPPPGL